MAVIKVVGWWVILGKLGRCGEECSEVLPKLLTISLGGD